MVFNRSSQMSLLDKTWFGGEVEKFFGSPALSWQGKTLHQQVNKRHRVSIQLA